MCNPWQVQTSQIGLGFTSQAGLGVTCVTDGRPHTSDSLTGNCLLSNSMVWANIVNLQRQMPITLQNKDDLRNMTMLYSRVRIRTAVSLRFYICVQFICTTKQLVWAKCVLKCLFTDLCVSNKTGWKYVLIKAMKLNQWNQINVFATHKVCMHFATFRDECTSSYKIQRQL